MNVGIIPYRIALLSVMFALIQPTVTKHADFLQGRAKGQTLWFRYDTPVKLTGILKQKWAYGPPNYGENPKTDKILYYYALELENPINVKQDTASWIFYLGHYNIRSIELLVGPHTWNRLHPFIGRRVTVTGKLAPKIFAREFTNVLLQVSYVQLDLLSEPDSLKL